MVKTESRLHFITFVTKDSAGDKNCTGRADFNADGRDDFALTINHDDGHLNQEVPVRQ